MYDQIHRGGSYWGGAPGTGVSSSGSLRRVSTRVPGAGGSGGSYRGISCSAGSPHHPSYGRLHAALTAAPLSSRVSRQSLSVRPRKGRRARSRSPGRHLWVVPAAAQAPTGRRRGSPRLGRQPVDRERPRGLEIPVFLRWRGDLFAPCQRQSPPLAMREKPEAPRPTGPPNENTAGLEIPEEVASEEKEKRGADRPASNVKSCRLSRSSLPACRHRENPCSSPLAARKPKVDFPFAQWCAFEGHMLSRDQRHLMVSAHDFDSQSIKIKGLES
jgi:hypothetical protein